MPGQSVNGHMFSFLSKEGQLGLRLPADEREAFLIKYKTQLCVQHGAVLKEYVEVPASLLKKTRGLGKFFNISYQHVSALKPKAASKSR